MFFFIGGVQPKTIRLDENPHICPECSHAGLTIKRTDSYLSLFFIPLFPVKKGIPFMVCTNCGAVFTQDGSLMGTSSHHTNQQCHRCGRLVGPDFIYCPYCGKPL